MKCSKVRHRISAYVDNELPALTQQALAAHLVVCAACRSKHEALCALRRIFAESERHSAPPALACRVMAHVREDAAGWSPPPLFSRMARVLAVVAVLGTGWVAGNALQSVRVQGETGSAAAIFALDVFEPVPPGSMAGVYLSMTELRHED